MNEVLNKLEELIKNELANGVDISIEKSGENEKISIKIDTKEKVKTINLGNTDGATITINSGGINCKGGFKVEDLAKELTIIGKPKAHY